MTSQVCSVVFCPGGVGCQILHSGRGAHTCSLCGVHCCCVVGVLVPVTSAPCGVSRSGLSTPSSVGNLERNLISKQASRLDAFSGYPFRTWPTSGAPGGTTGTPEVRPSRSSRTRDSLLQVSTRAADRDRTVSRRSEPSSRAALMGEQPNPWDLLQPQDATSRHRGAKPSRRYGLLGKISLLSPGYLLSVERHHIHK